MRNLSASFEQKQYWAYKEELFLAALAEEGKPMPETSIIPKARLEELRQRSNEVRAQMAAGVAQ